MHSTGVKGRSKLHEKHVETEENSVRFLCNVGVFRGNHEGRRFIPQVKI